MASLKNDRKYQAASQPDSACGRRRQNGLYLTDNCTNALIIRAAGQLVVINKGYAPDNNHRQQTGRWKRSWSPMPPKMLLYLKRKEMRYADRNPFTRYITMVPRGWPILESRGFLCPCGMSKVIDDFRNKEFHSRPVCHVFEKAFRTE